MRKGSVKMLIRNLREMEESKQFTTQNVVRSAKCHSCKHASTSFKIAGKTHHQCNHPKHEEGFKSGELSPWDTLQEWYNSCESHDFK